MKQLAGIENNKIEEGWGKNLAVGALTTLGSFGGIGNANAQNQVQKDTTQISQSISTSDFDQNTLDSIDKLLNKPNVLDSSDVSKFRTNDGLIDLYGGKPTEINGYLVELQDITLRKKNDKIIDISILVISISNKLESIDIDYVKTMGKFNAVSVSPIDVTNDSYENKGFTKTPLDQYCNDNKMAGYKIDGKMISNRKILSKHFIYIKKISPKETMSILQSLGK